MTFRYLKQNLTIFILLISIVLVSGFAIAHDNAQHELDINKALKSNSIFQMKTKMDAAYGEISLSFSSVEPIFKNSCYDCHSSQTVYPWYHSIPGIKGMMDSHVKDGLKHLNLSNGFPFGGAGNDQLLLLRSIREEIEEGEMPLAAYRLFHWGTAVDGATRDTLFNWIDSSVLKLEELYKSLGIPFHSEASDNDAGAEHSDEDKDNDDD